MQALKDDVYLCAFTKFLPIFKMFFSLTIKKKCGDADKQSVCGKPISEWATETLTATTRPLFVDDEPSSGHADKFIATIVSDIKMNTLLILNGFFPLLQPKTLKTFYKNHKASGSDATIIERFGDVKLIFLERAQLTENLYKNIANIAQLVRLVKSKNENAKVIKVNSIELLQANHDIDIIRKSINKSIINKFINNAVTIISPETLYVDCSVRIGRNVLIEPNVMITGNTSIAEYCHIGFNTKIVNCSIGQRTCVEYSVLKDSVIGDECQVGPFAYLRPGTRVGNRVKIGDFVEVKNSIIGNDTKASHLTYIGDTDVGNNVNFGCGTVIANYDGVNKYRSSIKDNAFIGCNTNLISPVSIESNACTAAGSTITKDVPPFALGIARQRQINIDNWGRNSKKRKK